MDLRRSVRAALSRLVADPAWWPPPDVTRFHNRLLDETGDDARELVGALVRLYSCDVAGRLPRAVITRAEWEVARRALVAHLGNEAGVEPALAGWAVDTWAVALATIEPELLEPAPPLAAPRRTGHPEHVSSGWVQAQTHGAPHRVTRGAVHSHGTAPPARPGANRNPLYTKWGTTPIPAFTSAHWTQRVNLDRLTAWVVGFAIVGTLGVQALGMLTGQKLASSRPPAAPGPLTPVSPTLVPVANPESPTLPSVASETLDPSLPVRPTAVANAPTAGAGVPDTVRMNDGRVLLGEVRLLTDSHLYLIERESALPYQFSLEAVRMVSTHAGRVLQIPHSAARPSAGGPTFTALGVGGRYRVHRRIVTVQGSASCQLGADAQAGAPDTEELIVHEPGSPRFAMVSRPGVQGRLEDNGQFTTEQLEGTKDGTTFRWRMEGRFTTTGFTAQAEARTEGTVGWRQSQECRFVSELTGERRP